MATTKVTQAPFHNSLVTALSGLLCLGNAAPLYDLGKRRPLYDLGKLGRHSSIIFLAVP